MTAYDIRPARPTDLAQVERTRPDGSRGNGSYCARLLRDALEKRKIPLLFSHRATRLVMNQKSEVIGLQATDGNGDPHLGSLVNCLAMDTHKCYLLCELRRGYPHVLSCDAPTVWLTIVFGTG